MADRITKGREFFAQVAQHLPDDLRAGFETFIQSGDQNAQQVLAAIGDGTLRQDAFSREMDALRETKTALEKWRDDLAEWARTNAGEGAPNDPLAAPRQTAQSGQPAAAVSKDDVVALFNQEMGRREIYFAKYVADATRLATQHFAQFGEVLDINPILAHPKLAELQLAGVYQELHKDKIAAKSAAEQAKEREELKRQLREELLAEQGPGAQVPYPIGEGGSPLDHLNGDQSQYTPEAAAAMYRQLVNAR